MPRRATAKIGNFQRGSDAYQRCNGAADQFPNPCIAPLEQPPFYAARVVPGELGTFAGIATNAHAQVIDGDGIALEGLYAVGNDADERDGWHLPRRRDHHRSSK